MRIARIKKAAAIVFLSSFILDATSYYYVNHPGEPLQLAIYSLLYHASAITGAYQIQNIFHYLLTWAKPLLFISATAAVLPQKSDKTGTTSIFLHREHKISTKTAAFALALLLIYDQLNPLQLAALATLGWTVFLKEKKDITSIIILTTIVSLLYLQNINQIPIDFGPGQTIAVAKSALKNPLQLYDGNEEGATYYTHPPLGFYMLALFFLLFGTTDITAIYATVSLTAVIIATTFYAGKKLYDERTGTTAAYLLAFSPVFYLSSASVHIDTEFALMYLLGVLIIYAANKKGSEMLFAASGVVTGAAILTKEAGILLWLAAVLYFRLYGKHALRKIIWFTAVTASFVGLWVLQGTIDWNAFTNAAEFRIGETLHYIGRPWYGGFLSAKFAGSFIGDSGGIFLLLATLGALQLCKKRKGEDVLTITAAIIPLAYFLFVSNAKETRYLLPTLPLLALLGARGAEWVFAREKMAYSTVLMLVLLYASIPLVATLQPKLGNIKYSEETKIIAAHIKENYDTRYLVVSRMGPAFNFYSGNRYLALPILPDYEEYFYATLEDNAQKTILVLNSAKSEFEWVSHPEKLAAYVRTNCSLQNKFPENEVYLC